MAFYLKRWCYRFGLEGVQDAHVGISVEHLVIDVLAVYQLQLEELQGLPGSLELVLLDCERLLQTLDQLYVFLSARAVLKHLAQLLVLLLHQANTVTILLSHAVEFVLYLVGPFDLLADHLLHLLVAVLLHLLLPNG